MAPLTHEDLCNFLKSTGRSAPDIDNVQYDVLRFICLNESLAELDIAGVLLRFLNIIIRQREMPASMKQATLTFIHKSGDPLEYKNYRGISLLSCLFKIVTGSLNSRLQTILEQHTRLNSNQGANRKGIHSAHKATVVMNIIADARHQKKPLHTIYTDIKGAFPSVPYQAFSDALAALGLDGAFLDLIKNTQLAFTCVVKGPTGFSSAMLKQNGVYEGDCLSPTLFCLVLNMYFHWLRSEDCGYKMTSASNSATEDKIKIPVNGYADAMALIGKSHQEAEEIFLKLQRFLSYYGMELNAANCGYQYLLQNSSEAPPAPRCRWGDIPNLHGKGSYKYLGYYVNMDLNLEEQYKAMQDKLNEACALFYRRQKRPISLHEAIYYANSDLVSKLRYRMYPVHFTRKYLMKIETALVKTVKRLCRPCKIHPHRLVD
jgi:hypothetical protein